MTDRCRYCDAPIIWARTTKGKWAPYNEEPVTEGVRFIISDDATPMAFATVIGEGHMSHVATCVEREKHRKAESGQGELDL